MVLKTSWSVRGLLEKLAISVPANDIYAFSSVLSDNAILHTLIDAVEHGTHGKRKSIASKCS
ncbi:hypothetical protein BGW80DRAFT_1281645 [Lactifluus volemus]|nr:hypothetical protein BGW80DRAFT_1281645 [Lactifluus volemus]